MSLLMFLAALTTCWGGSSDLMYSWLQAAIADNAEIVTASRRLARELRQAYDDQQLAAGKKAWLTPPIHSWHSWLGRQASRITDPTSIPRRLDPFSSSWLMERCLLRHMPDGQPGVSGIVRQSVQAWQRVNEWQVPLPQIQSFARSLDEQVFASATEEYKQQLESGDWVDSAGMASLVSGLIASRQVDLPGRLLFAGFDRLTPAVNSVRSALEKAGCQTEQAPTRNRAPGVSVLSFENMDAELRAAGAWARAILTEAPRSRIAIVSPVLESNAGQITRLVREGLVPGWQYGDASYAAAANVSYGRKLSDYPVIAIALLLLRWTHQGLGSRDLSILLRSSCIGEQRVYSRSRLELALRGHPDRAWSIEEFLRVFRGRQDCEESTAFFERLAGFGEIAEARNEALSPAEWARRIDAALQAVHWPGDATLGSSEFQLINRWRELLNEFAYIEMVVRRMDLAQACQRLGALAADTLFQPESGQGLVRVLGTLEAAGMEFDHVWVCGLDAAQWPPASRHALFVPKAIQRKYEMPDATPGDTLRFARRVLERLTASANHCVLSWASSADDAVRTASSLLEPYQNENDATAEDPGWYAAGLAGQVNLELCADDEAPPVGAEEQVRGGAYTVQRQYAEPFGAFVHGRLGVRSLDPILTGLSPSVRGNIIHNALHNLLAGKPDQETIRQWPENDLEQRIGSAIDSALAEHTLHADAVIRHVIGIERNRLRDLLQAFIAAELERGPFAIVDVEKKIDYSASGIRLGLRIDRIDKLADNGLLIIDYKTGLPKNFLNRDDDPSDLQLVVYAEALSADIAGLALINVDSRAINYKGAGREGGPWKARDEDAWVATLDSWRMLVREAMQGIADGDVRIDLLHSASEGRPLNILSRKEEQKRVD
jgi:probable DNA repair protein